jgi:hypothetical protein
VGTLNGRFYSRGTKISTSRVQIVLAGALFCFAFAVQAHDDPPAAWTAHAPRAEIKPVFSYHRHGGLEDAPIWTIQADDSGGNAGWWQTTLPVEGGKHYKFSIWRQCEGVETPRRSCLARVIWQDEKGQPVNHDEISDAPYAPGRLTRRTFRKAGPN